MLAADAVTERAERDAILAALLGTPAATRDVDDGGNPGPPAPAVGDGPEGRSEVARDRPPRRDDEP
jgi:hypothetical protein